MCVFGRVVKPHIKRLHQQLQQRMQRQQLHGEGNLPNMMQLWAPAVAAMSPISLSKGQQSAVLLNRFSSGFSSSAQQKTELKTGLLLPVTLPQVCCGSRQP